jgi:hypothetical protein
MVIVISEMPAGGRAGRQYFGTSGADKEAPQGDIFIDFHSLAVSPFAAIKNILHLVEQVCGYDGLMESFYIVGIFVLEFGDFDRDIL